MNWPALSLWILGSLSPGIIGSVFTAKARSWFNELTKPTWNPPSWIFAPVWTALYVFMGIAAYRVWTHGGFQLQRFALSLFMVQLGLNLTWSYIFFGRKRLDEALQEILFLWVAIAATLVLFVRVDLIAGLLLVPYLLWVSFAALLNSAIYQLNKKPKDAV